MPEKKFAIDTGDGVIEAENFRSFVEKLKAEKEFWEHFASSANKNASWTNNRAISSAPTLISEAENFWGNFVEEIEKADGRSFSTEFGDFRERVEASKPPPMSTSPRGQAIGRLVDEGRNTEASIIYCTFRLRNTSGANSDLQNTSIQSGAVFGTGFAANMALDFLPYISEESSVLRASKSVEVVDRLADQVGKTLEDIQEIREGASRDLDAFKNSTDKYFRRLHRIAVRKIWRENRRQLGIEERRTEGFQKLQDAFRAQLRLKQPVSLWEDREKEHEIAENAAWCRFVIGGLLFFLAAVLGAWFGGSEIANSFLHPLCQTGEEKICDRLYARGPLLVLAILTVSTIWLWYLRLQMKLRLSERHLRIDARERRAFAETYLSLLEGGEITKDQEAVVLASLFRPTEDGIVKDDGAIDTSLSGALAKFLERGRT